MGGLSKRGAYHRNSIEERERRVRQFLHAKETVSSISITLADFARRINVSESTFRCWVSEYRKKLRNVAWRLKIH